MLLEHLRIQRQVSARPVTRYRADTQTAQVFEDGTWVNSWLAQSSLMTKKGDIETGEDQKGT